jgi:hypothetical protein
VLLIGLIEPLIRVVRRYRANNGTSDAPSSDSGVAMLLERAHAAFSSAQPNTQIMVPNLVHDYVNTLTGKKEL